ncbi:MAG: DUF3078 domain-containing protein [Flavobacteriaceae bacterium]|nr:DUF3078 domain-containing protein [Flavobacteriaceae bacterium]
MKNYTILIFLFLSIPVITIAQEEEETPKDGWHKAGNVALLFNQAAFNAEWTGGGTSNYAANLTLAYDANYRKGKITWDNRIMADYGITKTRDNKYVRKTNDRLELNSILGRQIKESNWYYSFFANFRTQFTSGYRYFEDETGEPQRTETTKFLSPAYLQAGPGLLWKKGDDLKVNIAPATARLILVDDAFTQVNENDAAALDAYNMNKYFGVDANESLRFEFGAALGAYAKFKLMENITVENILNLYSNYLEDPQNVDIDYTFNMVMSVNKYISANFTFQTIYDDNAVQGFQVREALGIGLNYGF